jgi:hypothetical protein
MGMGPHEDGSTAPLDVLLGRCGDLNFHELIVAPFSCSIPVAQEQFTMSEAFE